MDREPALVTPWTDPDALLGFVDELRETGYNVATAQYVAVQDLVLALTARGEDLSSPARVRSLLGPILCGTPAEQDDFQVRFDDWTARFSVADVDVPSDGKARELERELDALRRWSRWWRWGLAGLLLVVAVVLSYSWFRSDEEPSGTAEEQPSAVPPGSPAPDEGGESPGAGEKAQAPPPKPMELPPAEPPTSQKETVWQRLALPALAALLVPLAWTLAWRAWWRYRAHLFLERHPVSERPEIQRVAVRSLLAEILPSLSLLRTAQDFRRRREVASTELDVPATVDATARRGGWLTPVPGTLQVMPEYLVLVDRTSFRDQQAKLVEELVDRLEGHDVLITRYHFDADPRICFPADKGAPASLWQLASKYPRHRLLVFSDAAGLFNASTGELEPWTDHLLRFEERALLTPGPPARLGRRASVLSRQLAVLPATSEGLTAWIRSLHGASPPEPEPGEAAPLPAELSERPRRWLERDAPEPSRVESVLRGLEAHLGKAGFYWLNACAVYPAMHLNLTVHLGNVLRDDSGKKLLEPRRLAVLTRLPWFRRGSMPDWLRLVLVSRLSKRQERSVRSALEALLLSTFQGAPADFELEIARGSGRSVSQLVRAVLRTVSEREPEHGPLRDHVFLSFMAGRRPRPLAVRVPERLYPRVLLQRHRQRKTDDRFIDSKQILPVVGTSSDPHDDSVQTSSISDTVLTSSSHEGLVLLVDIKPRDGMVISFRLSPSYESFRLTLPPQIKDFVQHLLEDIDRMTGDKAGRRLSEVGSQLFEKLLPAALRSRLWAVRENVQSLHIVSNETWIPWELLCLSSPDRDRFGPFLSTAFQVTRGLEGWEVRSEILRGRIAFVSPRDPALPSSFKEQRFLQSAFDNCVIINSRHQDVLQAMKSGNYDVWHFAGHRVDGGSLMLGAGEQLHPSDLLGTNHFGGVRPFVFLNIYYSGRGSKALSDPGILVSELLRAGAGAVISPRWSLTDITALAFAREFYYRFLEGVSIGEAVWIARRRVREQFPANPAWLSYVVYAHPDQRMRL